MKAILIAVVLICCTGLYGSINLALKPLKNDIYAIHIHKQMKRYMPIQVFDEQPVIWKIRTITRDRNLKTKE